MNYNSVFETALTALKDEKRYRVFADIERIAGRFPHALMRRDGETRDIVVWCSND